MSSVDPQPEALFGGRILELLRKLVALAASLQIDFTVLLKYISELAQLLPLPDLSDKDATRAWVRRLAGTLESLAEETDTTIDDGLAAMIAQVAESDFLWDLIYDYLRPDAADPIGPDITTRIVSQPAGDEVKWDVNTIIAIIMAIKAIIDLFRK